MPITTLGIGAAVTPTVVKTTFSHYTNRKERARKPTAHISYDQGLHLIRSFLLYASHHTVEDIQAFTAQWVPHPTWTRIEDVRIPLENISKAVELLAAELGEAGIEAVGGREWWQWRRKDTELKAEWVEMRSDYNMRQRQGRKCRRIMLYIHGGAYFFGSVDEHRYQIQRHARKLQARVFAPRYRLAPQFPFPCGLLDCLASYLYLLTLHEPAEIIFAGDSAGGGMILSLLCLLRDQNMPLPAGGILISPWVDLTHSFPSLDREDGYDYIPSHGFMQRPSRSWPPPNEDELQELIKAAASVTKTTITNGSMPEPARKDTPEAAFFARRVQPPLSLQLDGKEVIVKDQIQLYTTNQLITHPLVSPVLQPSLGGLPPLLIMVGGGELLRDEQIYIAHKAAEPQRYKLPERWRTLYDSEEKILNKYKPTPVQLQVWEDLCHVTPTLSFTRPAKFMYRSVAQFGAWALSRAQKRSIEIMDDDQSSTTSSSDDSDSDDSEREAKSRLAYGKTKPNSLQAQIGKAGDPLPLFKNNMIREQVDRHGNVYPLPRASDLPALQMSSDLVGVVKEGPIRKWLAAKSEWDTRYASTRRKIHKDRLKSIKSGQRQNLGSGECPPPSALAGRLQDAAIYSRTQKLRKGWGLGMWSSWGWKQDEKTIRKDEKLDKTEDRKERQEDKKERRAERGRSLSRGTEDEVIMVDSHLPLKGYEDRSEDRSRTSGGNTEYQRRKTIIVKDQGQLENDSGALLMPNAPIQDAANENSELATPALTFDPPTPVALAEQNADGEQSQNSMFMPKWKQASHLRGESKDISDTGSTYSYTSRMIPDNMSTRAVFSAPGVQRQDFSRSDRVADAQDLSDETANADNKSFSFRPTTPALKDNLGGYDTPHSRRSVERLRSHQTDGADGQSVHSSMPASVLDAAITSRVQAVRSPSAIAVVHVEGVIEPTNDAEQNATNKDDARNSHPMGDILNPRSQALRNASTMAVMHVEGVIEPTNSTKLDATDENYAPNSCSVGDMLNPRSQALRNVSTMAVMHVDGVIEPINKTELNAAGADHLPSSSALGNMLNPRSQALRNVSTMAVRHAEGTIEPVKSPEKGNAVDHSQQIVTTNEPIDTAISMAASAHDMTTTPTPLHPSEKLNTNNYERPEVPTSLDSNRPGMYNRADSTFVTAFERL